METIDTSLFTLEFEEVVGFDELPGTHPEPVLTFKDGSGPLGPYEVFDYDLWRDAAWRHYTIAIPRKWPTVSNFEGWGYLLDMALLRANRENRDIRFVGMTTEAANTLFAEKWLSVRSMALAIVNEADRTIVAQPSGRRPGRDFLLRIYPQAVTATWRWPFRFLNASNEEISLFVTGDRW